tara:strand:+ start:225 stop:344 length:120 start_codon:yes stop_codon:yes gene_type:complete
MAKTLSYYQSQMRKIDKKMDIKKAKLALAKKRAQFSRMK